MILDEDLGRPGNFLAKLQSVEWENFAGACRESRKKITCVCTQCARARVQALDMRGTGFSMVLSDENQLSSILKRAETKKKKCNKRSIVGGSPI